MLSFNIMDLGKPITAQGKSGSCNRSQPARPEDPTSDFSQELSLTLHNGNQSSFEQQGNLPGSKEVGKESNQEKASMNTDQPDKEAVAYIDLSIIGDQSEKPTWTVEDAKKGDWNQEKSLELFSEPPPLINISTESQLVLKRSLEEEAGPDSGLKDGPLLSEKEKGASKTDQVPREEQVVQAEQTGEGRPDLLGFSTTVFSGESVLKGTLEEEAGPDSGLMVNRFLTSGETDSKTDQIPREEQVVQAERTGEGRPDLLGFSKTVFSGEPVLKGTLEEEAGPDSGLKDGQWLSEKEKGASKTVQIPIDTFLGKKGESEENKLSGITSTEQLSTRNMEKNEKRVNEFFEFQTKPNSRSSLVKAVEKVEGGNVEKGSDQLKGTGPFYQSDGHSNDLKNSIPVKVKEGLTLGFNQEDPKNNPLIQKRSDPKNNGAVFPQPFEIIGAVKDFLNTGNLFTEKLNVLEHFQKPFGMMLSPGQTFIIKKQSPSSMEISLEPDGLGKLGIELKVTQDRIHGQITVSDSIGKDLIEKNLPQLLSEMVKEGLQIGEFSVSLKNQGRDQNSLQTPSEVREQPRTFLSSENVPIRKDHHLIHIII